jgi:3-isopropylmalate dehydrogenase
LTLSSSIGSSSLALDGDGCGNSGRCIDGCAAASASLDAQSKGLYEPSHGSAPDIAGRNIANPLATILSTAMMLRYTFNRDEWAYRIESAVKDVLAQGLRTADIYEAGTRKVGTDEMGDAVVAAL